ncbi:hypothetical protein HanPI659440_Chr17g0679371 [Helianthus annuus]|nr:hypothetical protein HanPI659440_Chr17g0679371 [Helianthus annuus]
MVRPNQLLPKSGTVMVSTRATLPKLIHVQNVRSAAWPLLGTITPSNLLQTTFSNTGTGNYSCYGFMVRAYVMVSPLSTTEKLLRVKNERISPATWLGVFFVPAISSSTNVFFTT